ncbi:hypothetical protein NECAME_02887 [Necator americanus]|uniref:Uncharacterized protein n=1 Tax=Necator americanus TaxID=51031 RepID=W2T8W5_NECAM|nr:hypothetical protein NECAME_02887 [Necator americanus]ETN78450.1 hypothetical protein NECAME_02887 [Necator americanus]
MSTSSSVPKPEITRDAIICDWKASSNDSGVSFYPIYSNKVMSSVFGGYPRSPPYWNPAQRHKS